jgi:hypothetical protein
MAQLAETLQKLCEASKNQYANPYVSLEWPDSVDSTAWYFSPELISLYGTPHYETFSEAEKKRLSFLEAVNFFSLNIHGEKALIAGLALQLYKKENELITSYLHHFLDEENKHMVYFGQFCSQYAGKVYPNKKLEFPRDYAPGEEDFLFFAKVLVFEEIVDEYNAQMSADERLAPIARQINLYHHRDESRHLVFGRLLAKELFERYSPQWPPDVLAGVRQYLQNYLVMTWKEYFNPDVYRDMGIGNAFQVHETVFSSPAAQAHRRQMSGKCIRYLLDSGILTEEPIL